MTDSREEKQEMLYALPYHWFPEVRLKKFERQEKRRLIYSLISKHLKTNPCRHLDVGCGDGRWTKELHDYLKEGSGSFGVDISSRAIAFAKLIVPDARFEVQDALNLQFPNEQFDLITAIEIIEHLKDGQEDLFLSGLHRILKKEGLLILTAPSLLLRPDPRHYRHYSTEQLRVALNRNNFCLLELKGQSAPCYGLMGKVKNKTKLIPGLWKLWKFSYRETDPGAALNLIVAARPVK